MAETNEVTVDRRDTERRAGSDRREQDVTVDSERRQSPRRKVQRRRQIDPTTCERDYNDDEIQFMQALDDYKRRSGRMFPTCSEILEVIRELGYIKPRDNDPEEAETVEVDGEYFAEDGEDQAVAEVMC